MKKNGRTTPRKLLARQLLHRQVRNRQGHRLGYLADLVVNAPSGRIEFGRLVLIDDHSPEAAFLDIPWSQFMSRGEHLELDVKRAVLERIARSGGATRA